MTLKGGKGQNLIIDMANQFGDLTMSTWSSLTVGQAIVDTRYPEQILSAARHFAQRQFT